jgi:adenine-specific DNA-methyltransferase
MENPNGNIEHEYLHKVTLGHRKKYAQYFTPYPIAELMARWLLKNEHLKTVLEPAFGLGVFSRTLLLHNHELSIKGFDIDRVIFEEANRHFIGSKTVQLLLEDYMYNDWENKYDGIICNPPYFKFHDYDNKSVITEIEQKLSCKLTGFTNLYTLFLLKSIHQLKTNGRCAYIVPSEFMNSDYGTLVKTHLIKTKTLRHVIVFDFEENVFDDALTTACILLCAKDNHAGTVQFTNISSIEELNVIEKLIDDYPKSLETSRLFKLEELKPEVKWRNYYQDTSGKNFKHLVPFSKYAKVVRGIATGANDFFTFNLTKAKEFGIDQRFLLPCISKCTDVKGQLFTLENFDILKEKDKKVFLLNATQDNDDSVLRYLKKGESEGVDKKYLTSSRNPWYALEKRPPAPIWVSVFNRNGLRFVRNYANVSNLTTFHCVYAQNDLFSDVSVDLLFSYLLTHTAKKIFEDNAREYGNGLQKFEPNDLNKGMMIDLKEMPLEHKQQMEAYYMEYIKNNDTRWIERMDALLIEDFAC